MNLTYKQIARQEGVSLVTAYKRYPLDKRPVPTQADIILLQMHGKSIRDVAKILGLSRMKIWRILNNG